MSKINEQEISDLKAYTKAQRIMSDLYARTQGETSVDELVQAVAEKMQGEMPSIVWVYEEAKLFFN